MIKKIICFGVILAMCLGLFIGCNSGIRHKVAYNGECGFGSKENENGSITFGLIEKVNSVDELEALCDEWNNPAFDEDKEGYSSEMSKKIREYNERFFQKKALIIYSSLIYNSEIEPRVEKLNVEGGELVIEVSLKQGTYTSIAESWLFLIEVNKSSVQDIINITIENTTRSKYK